MPERVTARHTSRRIVATADRQGVRVCVGVDVSARVVCVLAWCVCVCVWYAGVSLCARGAPAAAGSEVCARETPP
jgi:hypothetical protein